MSKSAEIAVILRLRDQMGGQAAKALDTLTRAARGVGLGAGAAARELGRLDRSGQGVRSVGIAAAATDKLMGGLGRTAQKAARDVAAVGQAAGAVKSVGTQAYEALRGLDQAARAGGRLRDALRGVGTAGQAALGVVKGVGQAGAGLAAGAGVAAASLRQPIAFEKRLALMANTAYADRDVAGRIAGKKELEGAVNTAVRQGGGSRDQAAEALDAMLASGAIKADSAQRLLPTIQKFASASGAGSGEIAEIVIRGIQQKFFSETQAGEALDKAMAAGQAGGFELKDMAKWLPKMMALGSGMKSMAGFEQILAYSQAAAITAGSKDEAGNNLVNLLQKLNSQDTQKDFARLGIDLTGTLARARDKGKLPLEAFAQLVDEQVVGKDKRYAGLKARLGKAQGGERQQILSDMADLAEASAVGKVVQDRQALLALIAATNQKAYIADVTGQIRNAHGAGETAYQVYQSTTAASVERAGNEAEIARQGMLGDVSGPLKAAADTAAELAQRFPTLATAAAEAATSIGIMSAAAAAFGAMRLFTGGAAGAAAGAAGAGGLAGMLGGKGGILATAGLAAWDIYATESNDALTRAQKNTQHTANAGGLAAAIAGMKLGAMAGAGLGSVVPGLGTGIGGILGGLAGGAMGWWGGNKAGQWAGNTLWGPREVAPFQKASQADASTVSPTRLQDLRPAASGQQSGFDWGLSALGRQSVWSADKQRRPSDQGMADMGGKAGRDVGPWTWGDQARQDAQALGAHTPWGLSGQAKADAQKIVVEDKSTLHVESVLHLDGREVARVVNTYNTAEAKRE